MKEDEGRRRTKEDERGRRKGGGRVYRFFWCGVEGTTKTKKERDLVPPSMYLSHLRTGPTTDTKVSTSTGAED